MSVFQNELDFASISLDQRLKTDLQSYFQATGYSVVSTESISDGALAYALSNIIPVNQNLGSAVCPSAQAFNLLCDMPSDKISTLPNQGFASTVAEHMAEKAGADVSIALLGMKGFPKNDVLSAKIFLAFNFKGNHSQKVLEVSGSWITVLNQCVVASLGFLQSLFMKYVKADK